MNIAVIAAGGCGKRFGGDKLFEEVCGKPVIWYSAVAFVEHEAVDGVVVVARESGLEFMKEMVEREGWENVFVVAGGESRQESVSKGAEFAGEQWDPRVLIIHNGANPMISDEEISQSIEAAREHGAAVVGRPAVNTLKRVENDEIVDTVDRAGVWEVQTPQTVEFDLFMTALNQARNDGFAGTDDVSLVERLGRTVMRVEASEYNFKITTPKDLEIFNFLIEKYGPSRRNWPR